MTITDLLSIGAIIGAINAVLGYWIKSRIEGSIKHEYDKELEKVKSEWKRTDILISERMAIFKLLQKRLVSIRRYCESHINSEVGNEFGNHPDKLDVADNKSILTHWTEFETLLDENLIFLSSSCTTSFEKLRNQLSLGVNMELWLSSSDPVPKMMASKADGYQVIIDRINECVNALFKDLGFTNEI
jgi:hypothetical protein